jgi:hypothetical protein
MDPPGAWVRKPLSILLIIIEREFASDYFVFCCTSRAGVGLAEPPLPLRRSTVVQSIVWPPLRTLEELHSIQSVPFAVLYLHTGPMASGLRPGYGVLLKVLSMLTVVKRVPSFQPRGRATENRVTIPRHLI